MKAQLQAVIVVPLVVSSLIGIFGLCGYGAVGLLGLPARLQLPWPLRGVGGLLLVGGLSMLGWIFRYRPPLQVLLSTLVTMRGALGVAAPPARDEPLVLEGPQRHLRHPMYFAVVLMWLGWWLLLDYTLLAFVALCFLLWFRLVVIPIEERELRSLFREGYAAYTRAVPRLLPSLRPRWP